MDKIGWQFCSGILCVVCAFILLSSKIEKITAEIINIQPIEIGFNGSWDEFCDYNKIEEDFVEFLDHDVKRIRLLLCELRNYNQITRKTMPGFVAYKYCAMIKSNLEDLYFQLRDKFALYNYTKTDECPTSGSDPDNESCYKMSMAVFQKECIGIENPCARMFSTVLRIACAKSDISTKDIGRHLAEICEGKYISDEIDWNQLLMSIESAQN